MKKLNYLILCIAAACSQPSDKETAIRDTTPKGEAKSALALTPEAFQKQYTSLLRTGQAQAAMDYYTQSIAAADHATKVEILKRAIETSPGPWAQDLLDRAYQYSDPAQKPIGDALMQKHVKFRGNLAYLGLNELVRDNHKSHRADLDAFKQQLKKAKGLDAKIKVLQDSMGKTYLTRTKVEMIRHILKETRHSEAARIVSAVYNDTQGGMLRSSDGDIKLKDVFKAVSDGSSIKGYGRIHMLSPEAPKSKKHLKAYGIGRSPLSQRTQKAVTATLQKLEPPKKTKPNTPPTRPKTSPPKLTR